jgi:hypothetical protein
MVHRSSCVALAIVMALAALTATRDGAAADDGKYPNLKGGWGRFVVRGLGGQPSYDQTKPWGRGQEAPLTPEYQKVLEDSLADQAKGGQGNFFEHALCYPAGMPFMMVATRPLEIIVTPETTYILVGGSDHYRRIFTDGRKWPPEVEASYAGYSIGEWQDTDRDGRFDTLVVETRGFKGPRTLDGSGLPLHEDNETVVKERIFLDKANPNVLHNEITVTDHALTRPWTVTRDYRRENAVEWDEHVCSETNRNVQIGKETYKVGADGLLTPTRRDQPPPDLRYFPNRR